MAILPKLTWDPTAACGQRHGASVQRVVVHRWGARFTTPAAEALSYHGVIKEFKNPKNEASAHIVYPGAAVKNEATQMVAWKDYAWTEAAYNSTSVEIESADAIWLGHDRYGLEQLARIVAFLLASGGGLHPPAPRGGIPPVWSTSSGFCRHADLGQPGGGHLECPTTDMKLWKKFVGLVQAEYKRGDFLATWGR